MEILENLKNRILAGGRFQPEKHTSLLICSTRTAKIYMNQPLKSQRGFVFLF